MKNPTEELTGIFFSLWSWDISLALNMTYFIICLCEGVKRPRQSPGRVVFARHILLTLVVGYFAYAQYDAKARVRYFAYAQYDAKAHVGYFACAQYDVKARVGYFACAQYGVKAGFIKIKGK